MSIDPSDMAPLKDPPSHPAGVHTVRPAPRKPVMATSHGMLRCEFHEGHIVGIGTSKLQMVCSCGWESNEGQINPVMNELAQHHRIIVSDRASTS